MLTILLSILFSQTLSFTGLTIHSLFAWFNIHPIIALIAIFDLCSGVGVTVNLLTSVILNLPYAGYSDYEFCDEEEECKCKHS